ncbi:MAG TPA: universal stress protein, partial [Longimicrobiales bacterium]
MYKKILVPLDGSETAEAAVPLAVAVCKATVGRLCLVHVEDPGPVGRAQLPAPDQYLDRAADAASNDLNESVDTAVIRA